MVVDTTIYHNGHIEKEKIYMDSKNQKVKEITFYENGKIKCESFFESGQNIKWISYDSTGKRIVEWDNPEIERSKYRNSFRLILILTFISLAIMTWLSWKFIGYKKTYFLIAFATIIVPIISLIFGNSISKINEEVGTAIASCIIACIIELSPFLLVLSIINLFKKNGIHFVISLFNVAVSLLLIVWLIISFVIAGMSVGIIG
jgi:spore maturation protein CgeB